MGRPLVTTVGSFPPLGSTPEESINRYADLQLELGFDLITDGEPRHDMISYLTFDIPGLGTAKGKPAVIGRIGVPRETEECLKARDLGLLLNHLRDAGTAKKAKIAITGPATLGFTCSLGGSGPYLGPTDPALYRDLAVALSSIAAHIQSKGAVVQIDEPGLSAGFIDPRRGADYLRTMTSDLEPSATIVHICGRISPVLHSELLRLENVGTFSHAFASDLDNLKVIDRHGLANSSKKLGAGCARVDVTNPEDVDPPCRIMFVLEKIKGAVGEELVGYAHPDCGLRKTGPDSAAAILHNLSEATKLCPH